MCSDLKEELNKFLIKMLFKCLSWLIGCQMSLILYDEALLLSVNKIDATKLNFPTITYYLSNVPGLKFAVHWRVATSIFNIKVEGLSSIHFSDEIIIGRV